MAKKRTQVDRRGRPLVNVHLQQRVEMRRRYIAQIPRWRHPLVGYVLAVPLMGLAVSVVLLGQALMSQIYFPGAPLFLAIILVAIIWGTGPALFAVLLGTVALDYFYISPSGQFTLAGWSGVLQISPFFLSGMMIAVISGQREAARRRALFAEQSLQEYAKELEQTNQELEQANQLKDKFLSMASHELKTPITSIRGQAQIALRRLAKKTELSTEMAPVGTALQKIDEQTRRLNALVDDLLDLSSLRAGKLGLRLSECDLRDVCCSVVEDQRLLTGRTIELDVPVTPVMVKADSDRMSQVVDNLVSNAIKYSPENQAVYVSVHEQDACARVEVCDKGGGIPKDQQKEIFETFYRAPDAQTSNKSGWGLGLAICKDIVERHGGRIWCESEKGIGSTFFVELPQHYVQE